jgi:hypothetical protein
MKAINKLEPPKPTAKQIKAMQTDEQRSAYLMEIQRWRRDRDQQRHDTMHEYARRFRELIVLCEHEVGESFSDVFEIHRTDRGRWSPIRRKFYRIMRDEGLSFPDIGKLCGVAHSSVMAALLAPDTDDTVR